IALGAAGRVVAAVLVDGAVLGQADHHVTPGELVAVAPLERGQCGGGRPGPGAAGVGEVGDFDGRHRPLSLVTTPAPSDRDPSLARSVTQSISPPRRALPAWPAGRPLRAWQQSAAAAVFSHDGDAFLASATPAAGKTTFGLHVAHRMLSEGTVARV